MVYVVEQKISRIVIVTLFIIFSINAQLFSQQELQEKTFIDEIYEETLVNGTTYSTLEELCRLHPRRLSGSKGLEETIQWAKELMEKRGFDNVYLQQVIVPFWERGPKESATIDINGKVEELAVIALGRSVPTLGEGITAPIIEVSSLEQITEFGREKLEGKIVFFNKRFEPQHIFTGLGYGATVKGRVYAPKMAAFYGAKAVVIRSVTTAKDDYPHTGSLFYAKKDTVQIPAGALSYRAADRLEEALKGNPSLKLTLKINSIIHPDAISYNVIGELKGSESPEKIIVVGGHIDAWDVGDGAHDDGAGTMQSVSALNTLKVLGYKPKNTLRVVLFTNEENGLKGGKTYADSSISKKEQHIFALESDMGGFSPRAFSFKGPEKIRLKLESWLPIFPQYTIAHIRQGGGGADISPLHKADGTPMCGLMPDSQRYFDVHHSDKDVFDAVNERELELGTASLASLIWLVDKHGLD